MSIFASIKDILENISMSSVVKERLAFHLDKMAALEKEHINLRAKHTALEENFAALEKKYAFLKAENKHLKAENEHLKLTISDQQQEINTRDVCPYCRKPAGDLIKIEPHAIFGDAGLKIGFYRCDRCGKEYDKEMPLPS